MRTIFTHNGKEIRGFRPVRWFAFASLLSIVAISIISSTLLSRYVSQTILQRDATVSMEFVNSIVRTQDATSYFYGNTYNPTAPELERFFGHIANMPGVLRANVYAQDRTVLWSSDRELIGRQFGRNDELELAFAGDFASKIEITPSGIKEEHVDLDGLEEKFVENYLPIWDVNVNTVIGVVEVYRSPDTLFQVIKQGQKWIWITSLMAGAFLFIGLYAVVKFVSGIVERQNAHLVEVEKLATIGEMASAVAHGLRNPLASIRSSAELCVEDEIPRATRGRLENIVSQSDRLECWIRKLLTAGTVGLSEEDRVVSVDAVIRDCLSGFSSQLDTNHVVLKLRLDSKLPNFSADPTVLLQAINSVISNSIEAMENGGELTVSSRCDASKGTACVEISDTGPGISSDIASRIFRPFTTTKPAGVGVGLALARRTLERLGGYLELSNRMNGGVSVKMTLPLES